MSEITEVSSHPNEDGSLKREESQTAWGKLKDKVTTWRNKGNKPERKHTPAKRIGAFITAASLAVPMGLANTNRDIDEKFSSPAGIEQVQEQKEYLTPESLQKIFDSSGNERLLHIQTTEIPSKLTEKQLDELQMLRKDDPESFVKLAPYLGMMMNLDKEIKLVIADAPHVFIENSKVMQDVFSPENYQALLEEVFTQDPQLLRNSDYAVLFTDIESRSEACKKLATLQNPYTGVLLEKMLYEGLSETEALTILNNKKQAFKTLHSIKEKPNHLAAYAVKTGLLEKSREITNEINTLHDATATERFASVEDFTAKELLTLMTYGEDVMYTSTFHGLFERLQVKKQQEQLVWEELFQQYTDEEKRAVIKEIAWYNRVDEFFGSMNVEESTDLLNEVALNIERTGNPVEQGAVVADIIAKLSDPSKVHLLKDIILSEYNRVSTDPRYGSETIKLYGFLASSLAKKLGREDPVLDSLAERYPFPDISEVNVATFFNAQNINIQRYFFYDDRKPGMPSEHWDGHNSFKHMLNTYGFSVDWDNEGNILPIPTAEEDGWSIEDKGDYVVLSSTEGKKKMKIYANKPTAQEEGPDNITKAMNAVHEKVQVVFHRGHSYHAHKTTSRISPDVKLVFLGSCGGYRSLLDAGPMQVIATKGIGTMEKNDAIMHEFNEWLLQKDRFTWHELWQTLEEKIGRDDDFEGYKSPDENVGLLYYKAMNTKKKEQISQSEIDEAMSELVDAAR